jgi:hypothetical protein
VGANSVYFFACPQGKVEERIMEIAGGFEISSVSHDYNGLGTVTVLLVLVGPAAALAEHDKKVEELLP